MLVELIMSIKKGIGKLVLLGLTCWLSFLFAFALVQKIEHPELKNMPIGDFIFLGALLIVMIVLTLFSFGILWNKKQDK